MRYADSKVVVLQFFSKKESSNKENYHWNYLLITWEFPMTLIAYIQHSVNTDWLFNTKLRVLQADWLVLENNEKATLDIHMPNS